MALTLHDGVVYMYVDVDVEKKTYRIEISSCRCPHYDVALEMRPHDSRSVISACTYFDSPVCLSLLEGCTNFQFKFLLVLASPASDTGDNVRNSIHTCTMQGVYCCRVGECGSDAHTDHTLTHSFPRRGLAKRALALTLALLLLSVLAPTLVR